MLPAPATPHGPTRDGRATWTLAALLPASPCAYRGWVGLAISVPMASERWSLAAAVLHGLRERLPRNPWHTVACKRVPTELLCDVCTRPFPGACAAAASRRYVSGYRAVRCHPLQPKGCGLKSIYTHRYLRFLQDQDVVFVFTCGTPCGLFLGHAMADW